MAIATTSTKDTLNLNASVGCSIRFYSQDTTAKGQSRHKWHDIPDATIRRLNASDSYGSVNANVFIKDKAEESIFDPVQSIPVNARGCSDRLLVESLASGDARICEIYDDCYDHWVKSRDFTNNWGTVRGKLTVYAGDHSNSSSKTADSVEDCHIE
ncbi:hypothetical protein I302_103579 [Kwoniella bestiolae CBS 10118]|uniref:Uncharacterized protein n=1 Tax=Kwoniella bestiolae CBS 10118 TaxID=1296100 RepID=A0A1B9G8T3_9TREE|nr:hypothetical protein I302_02280 [Kwoniella bestiolae CBS 10118]OCF27438.1 hypothetical protein I302_02280 [Kwoniella bestiolae CBS 10118]